MEYQKIINLLNNTPNQPSTFKTKDWVEIHDESPGTYDTISQIKFKTLALKSSLSDYSGAYILANGTTTVAQETTAAQNNANKKATP